MSTAESYDDRDLDRDDQAEAFDPFESFDRYSADQSSPYAYYVEQERAS